MIISKGMMSAGVKKIQNASEPGLIGGNKTKYAISQPTIQMIIVALEIFLNNLIPSFPDLLYHIC